MNEKDGRGAKGDWSMVSDTPDFASRDFLLLIWRLRKGIVPLMGHKNGRGSQEPWVVVDRRQRKCSIKGVFSQCELESEVPQKQKGST